MVTRRLNPRRWPVRWRLAIVSAALTFVILVVFAVVVGRLATNRIRSDFDDDLRGTASTVAEETHVVSPNPFSDSRIISPPNVSKMALAPNSALRIVDAQGNAVPRGQTPG